METSRVTQRSIPSWLLGGMAGLAVWLTALTMYALFWFTDVTSSLPDWLLENPVVSFVLHACVILTLPIAMGGWVFVWGDNGPPFRWMNNTVLNYALGVSFCAMMGAAVGYSIGLGSRWATSRGSADDDVSGM